MTEEHELFVIARQLRYDLTAIQAKISDLLVALERANLPLPTPHLCLDCGLHFRGPLSLAEHAYHSHNGPEPDHWLEVERKAAT